MIFRLLKGRGMVSGLFGKKWDAIPPHPASTSSTVYKYTTHLIFIGPTYSVSNVVVHRPTFTRCELLKQQIHIQLKHEFLLNTFKRPRIHTSLLYQFIFNNTHDTVC
jgi:hypothetical protein